jgi:hypothetical protein
MEANAITVSHPSDGKRINKPLSHHGRNLFFSKFYLPRFNRTRPHIAHAAVVSERLRPSTTHRLSSTPQCTHSKWLAYQPTTQHPLVPFYRSTALDRPLMQKKIQIT